MARLLAFGRATGGNATVIVAIFMLPMLIAMGASLDTIRAYNTRARMQQDLDFALIAAVRELGVSDPAAVKAKIADWFAAQQTGVRDGSFALGTIAVATTDRVVTASAEGSVPTTLLSIASVATIPVSVQSKVAAPDGAFMNVYFVIDKSASMLLAATTAGQTLLQAKAGCVFACHDSEGAPRSNYDIATQYGIQLRSDVAVNAVSKALNMIDDADPIHDRIKVGLYTIGETATEVMAPNFSTSLARAKLADGSSGLTSATSTGATAFDVSLGKLSTLVGSAGDGTTADKPQKLVLLLTDGVQSRREWVTTGVRWPGPYGGKYWYRVAPLNPDWCLSMKQSQVTIGTLYTTYLPIVQDWGYQATVGSSMASANWKQTWGGVMRPGLPGSMTRQSYLPYALTDCASSSDLFIAADSSVDIEKGLKTILRNYMTALRIMN